MVKLQSNIHSILSSIDKIEIAESEAVKSQVKRPVEPLGRRTPSAPAILPNEPTASDERDARTPAPSDVPAPPQKQPAPVGSRPERPREETPPEVKTATPAVERRPRSPLEQGKDLFDERDFDGARAHFEKMVELDPEDGAALAWLAWTRYSDPPTESEDALPLAKQTLVEANRLSPDSSECYYLLGELCLVMKEADRAQSYFKHALKLDASNTAAQSRLLGLYQRQGKPGAKRAKRPSSLLDRLFKKK